MLIAGFIKQSFIDYPGKIASVIFTGGCNLRCPYCHNSQLILPHENIQSYPEDVILEYLKKNAALLDALVITGGEPLMNADIFQFIKKIKSSSLQIKIDTNGTFPERLKEAMDHHLVDYVAMDIKQVLNYEKYRNATGHLTFEQFEKIKQSIAILNKSNTEFEFRTTIAKGIHTMHDLEEIAGFTKHSQKWALQNFKNENVADNQKKMESFSNEELESMVIKLKNIHPGTCLQ